MKTSNADSSVHGRSWFPILVFAAASARRGGKTHEVTQLYDELANDLGLNEEDRAQLLKSGRQYIYENRIGWARTYLKKAGLLESPGRGLVITTDRGKQVLAQNPPKINVKFLRQFPEFVEFHTYRSEGDGQSLPPETGAPTSDETPQDTLERIQRQLNDQLAVEILERVKKASPSSSNDWWSICSSEWATAVPEKMRVRQSGRAGTVVWTG